MSHCAFFNRNGFILSDNEICVRISLIIPIYPYNNLFNVVYIPFNFPSFSFFSLLNIKYIEIWHLQIYLLLWEGIYRIIIKSILMGIQRTIFTNDNIILTIRNAKNQYCCIKHNCDKWVYKIHIFSDTFIEHTTSQK